MNAALPTVEASALFVRPPEYLLGRRCMTSQNAGPGPMVDGDRLLPIAAFVSSHVPTREHVAIARAALVRHRQHYAANDTAPALRASRAS